MKSLKQENILQPKRSLFNKKDFLGLIIFLIIPLGFFVSNFITEYRILYYGILLLFVIIYALIGQFFYEEERFSNFGKRLVALTIINTLVISFVNFTGNTASPYFFVVYLLLFSVAIIFPVSIFALEGIVVFFSVFIAAVYDFGSLSLLFSSISSLEKAALLSIPAAFPLVLGISVFVQNLTVKQQLLSVTRNLLAVQDIEGEALLSEINQGIIILDPSLKIVKISKWIERNLNTTARVILGKEISDLAFYDAVTNKGISKNHSFYKNLVDAEPKKLNWRVLYKNQYDKFVKLVIKQKPLIVNERVIGFLLVVRHPPKSLRHVVTSFNQLFNLRLSSSIAIMKNLIEQSKSPQEDPQCKKIEDQLEFITKLLNDASIKNDISEGNLELVVTGIDVQSILKNVITKMNSENYQVSVWNISPLYKNRPIMVETDPTWCERFFDYAIRGALYLGQTPQATISVDEDTVQKRPVFIITTDVQTELTERIDLLEPFFAGKLMILSKYRGTGLEISNANLLAKFLGFDFSAEISNNKLVIKIIF